MLTAKERAFHKKRWMFAIVQKSLLIAPDGSTDGHREWLTSLLGPVKAEEVMSYSCRGSYIFQEGYRGLHFYVGNDFREAALLAIEEHIERIALAMDIPPEVEVFNGMQVGTPGELWKPLSSLGTIRSVCKWDTDEDDIISGMDSVEIADLNRQLKKFSPPQETPPDRVEFAMVDEKGPLDCETTCDECDGKMDFIEVRVDGLWCKCNVCGHEQMVPSTDDDEEEDDDE